MNLRTLDRIALAVWSLAATLWMTVLGCAAVKKDAAAAKVAVVECAKQDLVPILTLAASLGVQALDSQVNHNAIDWPGIESAALGQGKVVGGCALARFVAELAKQPRAETSARALVAGPDPAADGQAALARLSAKFGGATWSVR